MIQLPVVAHQMPQGTHKTKRDLHPGALFCTCHSEVNFAFINFIYLFILFKTYIPSVCRLMINYAQWYPILFTRKKFTKQEKFKQPRFKKNKTTMSFCARKKLKNCVIVFQTYVWNETDSSNLTTVFQVQNRLNYRHSKIVHCLQARTFLEMCSI